MPNKPILLIFLLIFCLILTTCEWKLEKVIKVSTKPVVTSISTTAAVSGGNIIDEGNSNIRARGVCWSTSSNPTIALSTKTSDSTGTGIFTSNITGLTANTTYYVRAYATNNEGTGYGNEITFVTDIDVNVYNTVTIGKQVWMKENLKTTKYKDGETIPNITTTWATQTTGAYCWYDNNVANKLTYGALYNWHTVNTRKLCPTGWHVPTDAEWTTLEDYLIANGYNYDGTTTEDKLAKSLASASGWVSNPIIGAVGNTDYPEKRNATGFTALPGGEREVNGTFYFIGITCTWWSAQESDALESWCRFMNTGSINLIYAYFSKPEGLSVRCLRDF